MCCYDDLKPYLEVLKAEEAQVVLEKAKEIASKKEKLVSVFSATYVCLSMLIYRCSLWMKLGDQSTLSKLCDIFRARKLQKKKLLRPMTISNDTSRI